jgi:hypothetical protein
MVVEKRSPQRHRLISMRRLERQVEQLERDRD